MDYVEHLHSLKHTTADEHGHTHTHAHTRAHSMAGMNMLLDRMITITAAGRRKQMN